MKLQTNWWGLKKNCKRVPPWSTRATMLCKFLWSLINIKQWSMHREPLGLQHFTTSAPFVWRWSSMSILLHFKAILCHARTYFFEIASILCHSKVPILLLVEPRSPLVLMSVQVLVNQPTNRSDLCCSLAANRFCKTHLLGRDEPETPPRPPRPLIRASPCPDGPPSSQAASSRLRVCLSGDVFGRTSLAGPPCLVSDWGD